MVREAAVAPAAVGAPRAAHEALASATAGWASSAERLERVDELSGDVERGVAGAARSAGSAASIASRSGARARGAARRAAPQVAEHEEHVRQRVALLGEARRLGERRHRRRHRAVQAAGAGGGAQ